MDSDGNRYLPLLVQPVVVLEASAGQAQDRARPRERREVPIALYTADMFATGDDTPTARRYSGAVATADLDIVGIALRAPHRDADAVLRGLDRHPSIESGRRWAGSPKASPHPTGSSSHRPSPAADQGGRRRHRLPGGDGFPRTAVGQVRRGLGVAAGDDDARGGPRGPRPPRGRDRRQRDVQLRDPRCGRKRAARLHLHRPAGSTSAGGSDAVVSWWVVDRM